MSLQDDMDDIVLGSDNPFRESISGIPSGGVSRTLYAVVDRNGPEMARMKGGHELSFAKKCIHVSKTDWPVVTKNEDRFTLSVNGTNKTLTVASIIEEDSVSYYLALI